ncbi:ABC-type transporter, periplasmic subunit family 3 [Caldithrix abyssi DSM 13497]|uniref:ABC-type transporter, periplasmic subunit family 3 n=1 Tax=Caldithrix abyssi DSM 13497 TaxID=880073 RepID=H1XVT6_CALAY|nr:transporter substrate-binding domain-containing protein [Caldithrix abyssi]APF20870.1 amino acid ABC transporter substrate-binding protein, PAAT family [Caldithrix abyssi DSM 13497]EHO40663.1 ABC-type transporter, periplasmic subunit family 3 [Caldithrix abyssi DSM 13497]
MKGLKVILSFVFVCLLLFSCDSDRSKSNYLKQSKSTYQRILESGKIRVGYISYPPSFIKDPNTGKFSGIFHEVLQEIGKKLQLKIEYTEEVGWGSMIEAINSGRVDLICTGVWPTTERGKHVDFTKPLYYSTVRAYVRFNDNRFDGNLTKINNPDIRISSIDGEMTSIIAKFDFPKAKEVSLTQMNDVSQVLLEVSSGKADITFVEPAIALEYMSKNPGKIKEVKNVPPLRVFPNTMIVGKGEVELLSTINIGIDELANNGFIDKIVSKYEKFPGSFQKIALPFREE